MNEDISIINSNTKVEKIKDFLKKNKSRFVAILIGIFIILIAVFGYQESNKQKKIQISNKYNSLIIMYSQDNKEETINSLIEIIYKKDSTYSPLSLYFIIENDLILDPKKINELFDVLINKTSVEKEIKNLLIYKKALYNSDKIDEITLLTILKPILNSESIWKSHALYLVAEFFYSKKEFQKAKEFFEKIVILELSNIDIKLNAQKRLSRDLSE
jgi:predicted negative regulator of RcsB-dependent stress response